MTGKISRLLILIAVFTFQNRLSGQWDESGNPLLNTGLFGSTTNWDILFVTDNVNRMQLMETGTTTIDGYSIDYDGHLGLSLTPSFFGTGTAGRIPYSLLHLNGTGNNAGGAQEFGYRDWMQPGIIFTHNSDLMYIGPKVGPGGEDQTDAVISWSDNDDGPVGPDVLRFLFTAPGAGTTAISANDFSDNDYDGVEIARMHGDGRMGVGVNWNNAQQPKRTLDVVNGEEDQPQLRLTHLLDENAAIGSYADFEVSANGDLYISPELDGQQRALAVGFRPEDIPTLTGEVAQVAAGTQTVLDVNGLTRVRNLPLNGVNSCVVIGSNPPGAQNGDEDHYLKRLDFTGNTSDYLSGAGTWETFSGVDCRWLDVTSLTVAGETDIYTGFINSDDCDRGKVGIGVNNIRLAKLEVSNQITRDEVDYGIYGGLNAEAQTLTAQPRVLAGVFGDFFGGNASTTTDAGVYGQAFSKGKYQVGVYGRSISSVFTVNQMGIAGVTDGIGSGSNIGVYGEVAVTGPSSWGGLFLGGTALTGMPVIVSDESVKTNVEELTNATELINSLAPKTYEYVSPGNRDIPFDAGTRYGFVAQDVQPVLPNLVREARIPEKQDSTGAFIQGTSVDLLGVRYTEIIPILVGAFKEQYAANQSQINQIEDLTETNQNLLNRIDDLEASMAQMENQLSSVLSSFQALQSNVTNCCGTTPMEKTNSETGRIELEQNFPNPFETETTINFTISETAQIRLEISDAQGRVLDVLVNQRMSEGRYTERWDASAYAPGTYYYSLYADTELLTKKMIKR